MSAQGLEHSDRRKLWMIIGMVIAILGIAVTSYSINHHIEVMASGQTDAACNINETFSCDDVALSEYSEIAGIPLGVWGFGYFAAMLVLLAIGWRGGKHAAEHLHAYAAMVLIGVLTSIALFLISKFEVGALCVSCIGVYALTLVQGAALLAFKKEIPEGMTIQRVFSGGTTGAIAVAAVVVIFAFVDPMSKTTASEQTASEGRKDVPVFSDNPVEIPVSRSPYSGLGEDYRKGSDSAKIVINEFADLQCPACASIASTMSALAREYGDRVQIVFRNYPLDKACNSSIKSNMHEYACKAAVMARCAGQYGKFWEYHDLAFARQRQMNFDKLKEWGRQIGLTQEQIDTCWESPDLIAKIKDDIALGNKIGVDATPTLFINGRKYLGRKGLADIRAHIDQLLLN